MALMIRNIGSREPQAHGAVVSGQGGNGKVIQKAESNRVIFLPPRV
jgi:hypothetical protein